jgi:hypothetical protein
MLAITANSGGGKASATHKIEIYEKVSTRPGSESCSSQKVGETIDTNLIQRATALLQKSHAEDRYSQRWQRSPLD